MQQGIIGSLNGENVALRVPAFLALETAGWYVWIISQYFSMSKFQGRLRVCGVVTEDSRRQFWRFLRDVTGSLILRSPG